MSCLQQLTKAFRSERLAFQVFCNSCALAQKLDYHAVCKEVYMCGLSVCVDALVVVRCCVIVISGVFSDGNHSSSFINSQGALIRRFSSVMKLSKAKRATCYIEVGVKWCQETSY